MEDKPPSPGHRAHTKLLLLELRDKDDSGDSSSENHKIERDYTVMVKLQEKVKV